MIQMKKPALSLATMEGRLMIPANSVRLSLLPKIVYEFHKFPAKTPGLLALDHFISIISWLWIPHLASCRPVLHTPVICSSVVSHLTYSTCYYKLPPSGPLWSAILPRARPRAGFPKTFSQRVQKAALKGTVARDFCRLLFSTDRTHLGSWFIF